MKRIFVGNVDFSITKAQLSSLFQPYGTVESVSLVSARDTGQTCGCGFIEMRDSTEGEQAIAALNGRDSCGRPLVVKEAPPKSEQNGDSKGGGRDHSRGEASREPRW